MRTYQRKTGRIRAAPDVVISAAKTVNETGRSVRDVAAEFGLNFLNLLISILGSASYAN